MGPGGRFIVAEKPDVSVQGHVGAGGRLFGSQVGGTEPQSVIAGTELKVATHHTR